MLRGTIRKLGTRRSRKDISEEDKRHFDGSMKDDGFAGKAVLDFSRDNPPEMKK